MSEIIEFAEFEAPVLKAGVHYPNAPKNIGAFPVTEEFLDEFIESSNLAKEFIKSSSGLTEYPENDKLNAILDKPIPGPLNIHHQELLWKGLNQDVKKYLKDVDWEYVKQPIKGENWAVQRFKNVPKDVAMSLKKNFPYRSLEILKQLNVPGVGVLRNVGRSTAFLNKYTPPAVKGQIPDLAVEFAEGDESPVIVLMCDDVGTEPITTNQEAPIMPEINVGNTPEVDVSELTGQIAAQETQIAELQAEIAESKGKDNLLAELQAKQEAADQQIVELQRERDAAEVVEFCRDTEAHLLTDEAGNALFPSPSFMTLVRKHVMAAPKAGVIEFAEGKSATPRQAVQEIFTEVLELARKGGLLVPAPQSPETFRPSSQKQTRKEYIAELQAAEPSLTYGDAWEQAEVAFAKEDN